MVAKQTSCKEHGKRLNEVELTMVEVRSDIQYIKKDLGEIKAKLDVFIDKVPDQFVNKTNIKHIEHDVVELKNAVRRLEMKWAYATGIAIVLVTVLQIILNYYGVV